MRREVGRFGHAARLFLGMGICAMCLAAVVTLPSWTNFFEAESIVAAAFGTLVWLQMSQRVWYDDQNVWTHIWGKEAERIRYTDIQSVSASHSWARAAKIRPISELQITDKGGRSILISLRHLSLGGLQEMVDEIHRRTGVEVPELRKSVK